MTEWKFQGAQVVAETLTLDGTNPVQTEHSFTSIG